MIQFHPETNVITGVNDTGKSSLIKSLYYTLGAEPVVDLAWQQADVASLLCFSVDQVRYKIYRRRNSFILFDSAGKEIGAYSSVTKQLAPVLADLFDFRLKLTSQQDEQVVPTPAFLFLPFYIDQDKGWTTNWNSFTKLQQFKRWKQPVADYHVGMKPNEWHKLNAERQALQTKLTEPEQELRTIEAMLNRTRAKIEHVGFDIDVDAFKAEIDLLLQKCNELKQEEEKYRLSLADLGIEKIRLEAQIEIVKRTFSELELDYEYASELTDEVVDCPTCGTPHENSFVDRFNIAKDTETCSDLLQSLEEDLALVTRRIEAENAELNETSKEQEEIQNLLGAKQGEIQLDDLVKQESRKELIGQLEESKSNIEHDLGELHRQIAQLRQAMKKFEDPKHRQRVKTRYNTAFERYGLTLNVRVDEKMLKSIAPSINLSGSDQPRALLAYYFTILECIRNTGNATFCPMVIDAPNQQDQDKVNLQQVVTFIRDVRPSGRQLILGLGDTVNIDFSGNVLELTEKYRLLQAAEYDQCLDQIRKLDSDRLR